MDRTVEAQKDKIKHGIYMLLYLVIIVSLMLIAVMQFQQKESERRNELAYDYHFTISEKGLKLLNTIDKARLWFRSNLVLGKESDVIDDVLHLSPIKNSFSREDYFNELINDVDLFVKDIIKIQTKYADTEFKKVTALLLNNKAILIQNLNSSKGDNSTSIDSIESMLRPFVASVHQVQRLHQNAYHELRASFDSVQADAKYRIFVLISLLVIVAIFGISRILSYVNHSLQNLAKAEGEIKSQEKILEQINDAIILTNREGVIEDWNKGAEKMFALQSSEVIGKKISELCSEDEWDYINNELIKPVERSRTLDKEVRLRKGDEWFSAYVSMSIINDSNGEEAGMVAYCMDVSERSQVESILRSLAKGASGLKFESFMGEVLEHLTDLYNCEYALVGLLDESEQNIKTICLRSNGQFVKEVIYPLKGTPCQDVLNGTNQYVESGASEKYLEDEMLRNMGVDSYLGSALVSSTDETIGILAVMGKGKLVIHDWTRSVLDVFASRISIELESYLNGLELQKYRQSLEGLVEQRTQDLRQARDEAERANVSKSEFLSRMSHELRTPMNAILGFGQMLKMDEQGFSETQKGNIQEILDAGDHLLELINEVLDLAKIESGKLKMDVDEVDIHGLLGQCVSLISPQAAEYNLNVVNNMSDENISVKADAFRLKQVIINLLSNAVKYNHKNGNITIHSKRQDNDMVRICVSDTGDGLTEKDIEKLFMPFERLNALNNVEGTGIGLVITKHLVEMMGGQIGVTSKPGFGSTFWVEFQMVN